jgi:hypothetical protein
LKPITWGFGPIKCKPPTGTCPALCRIFLLVEGKPNTDIETVTEDAIIASLVSGFATPVYLWDLAQKRAFLLLGVLSRWNPSMGPILQDQLIIMTGLDLGLRFPSRSPNALRALTIAISRKHSIKLSAEGNGHERSYCFSTTSLRESVATYMKLPRSEKISRYLATELHQARIRSDW